MFCYFQTRVTCRPKSRCQSDLSTVSVLANKNLHQDLMHSGCRGTAVPKACPQAFSLFPLPNSPLDQRPVHRLKNCKGIVSSTILRLMAFQKERRTNRPPKLPPCLSIFSKPLELKFQIKTSISPIVSLPELPLLALDQLLLFANSQELL